MITQEILKTLFNYDPDTGIFTRKIDRRKFKAGTVAGGVNPSPNTGYVRILINGKLYPAHRLAWLYVHGYLTPGPIDHINRVRTDNRLCNLRLATISENNRNQSLSRKNTSGHTGVVWDKRSQRWFAYLHIQRKRKHLGSFKEIADAIASRKDGELKYYAFQNAGIAQVSQ